jgi:hypothetical protein
MFFKTFQGNASRRVTPIHDSLQKQKIFLLPYACSCLQNNQ